MSNYKTGLEFEQECHVTQNEVRRHHEVANLSFEDRHQDKFSWFNAVGRVLNNRTCKKCLQVADVKDSLTTDITRAAQPSVFKGVNISRKFYEELIEKAQLITCECEECEAWRKKHRIDQPSPNCAEIGKIQDILLKWTQEAKDGPFFTLFRQLSWEINEVIIDAVESHLALCKPNIHNGNDMSKNEDNLYTSCDQHLAAQSGGGVK
jgi:hypothetical protein